MSDFNFGAQLAMSDSLPAQNSIDAFIRENFSGVSEIKRASTADDKKGTDYWITLKSGKKYSVDVKIREEDFSRIDKTQDDLALELWSVLYVKPGWTRDENKATDFVLWYWIDTGRTCMVSFPFLCAAFKQNMGIWIGKYTDSVFEQVTVNPDQSEYVSQCIFVPRLVVLQAINDKFGGGSLAA